MRASIYTYKPTQPLQVQLRRQELLQRLGASPRSHLPDVEQLARCTGAARLGAGPASALRQEPQVLELVVRHRALPEARERSAHAFEREHGGSTTSTTQGKLEEIQSGIVNYL